MERKILDAGKKTAEELAPEPIKNVPEAPIISEEEAQIIESPEGAGNAPEGVHRRQSGPGHEGDGGKITIRTDG